MEKIWIVGIGQFGFIAYHRLSKGNKHRDFFLLDPLIHKFVEFYLTNPASLQEALVNVSPDVLCFG